MADLGQRRVDWVYLWLRHLPAEDGLIVGEIVREAAESRDLEDSSVSERQPSKSALPPRADVRRRQSRGMASRTVIIEPRKGLQCVDWAELYAYRDLFRFLVWREIKVRYAQSAVGIGWAVLQPLFSMVVFTVVFGKLAGLHSDGAPYAVFSFTALVPWTYFSNALTDGVNSLVSNANMLRKIYFPRAMMPLAAITARLLDFCVAFVVLAALMVFYQLTPTIAILAIPLLVLLMVMTASGAALWLTSLAVQYRDIKHGMVFFVQILMYAAPVVYSIEKIPPTYRLAYAINPMVGVIEGFRSALLGTRPMPWDFLLIGSVASIGLLFSGMLYFRRKERLFADVA